MNGDQKGTETPMRHPLLTVISEQITMDFMEKLFRHFIKINRVEKGVRCEFSEKKSKYIVSLITQPFTFCLITF